jgi:hypothetical protein
MKQLLLITTGVPIQIIVDGLEDGIGPRMQPNTEGIAGTWYTLPP